jgi:hypothetical protein
MHVQPTRNLIIWSHTIPFWTRHLAPMPAVFDKNGISFLYPENWKVEEMEPPEEGLDEGECMQVVAYGPETAFWQLSQYPANTDLEALFDQALATMRKEYPGMDAEPAVDEVDSLELEGYDINFFCLELTNTTWIRGYQNEQATYLLLCQAEDRELEHAGPVFRAMWTSLFRELCPDKGIMERQRDRETDGME